MDIATKPRVVVWTRLFGTVMLALGASPIGLLAQGDITGEWELTMDRNGRESFATLTISKKADGSFAGKWGSAELSSVKFDGQKLSFVRTLRFGDQEFSVNYDGTLKDGRLTGTVSSERGNYAANGARRKPRHPALGRWDFKYTVGDRDIAASLAISEGAGGALDGKWTSGTGEHVVSNVKFSDGKLSFDRKIKLEDREIDTSYEGKLQGHKLTGVIKSAMGEIPADGQRFGAELIGDWELTSSTDAGTRTSQLRVYSDLSGRYETFGGEIPIKAIKLDGAQVSFSIETGFGDQTFTIDFKGKLDGKTLKGEVTTPRGTREVSGKKAAAPAAAIAGTWEITREGSEGTRTVTLTIKEDMTATYAYQDNTAAVTDLRFEGGQLSFKVTVRRGERDVPMEFKGTVEGNTLKGQFTTARGVREATGKKLAPSASL